MSNFDNSTKKTQQIMETVSDLNDMTVIKRNGNSEIVSFDKILNRIKNLGLNPLYKKLNINYTELAIKVIDQLYDGIKTTEIDELTSEQCASMSVYNPDYGILASRICISNNHKNTSECFSDVMKRLYNYRDIHDKHYPLLSDKFFDVICKLGDTFDSWIDYSRDYDFDYFGYKTLERAYLMKINGTIVERPQHMWMRVSIGIHFDDLERVKETYDLMSRKYFTHATPTLFNAGTPRSQMSSCYLLAMQDDSIQGIYNTLGQCAAISKYAGGIGLHIHNVRSNGAHIRGTNGKGDGIVPMLKVFNATARYVNQSGKRNGSFAMYLEPWHSDITDFLEMKKNHGDEEKIARDLFYALWIPDLFMERVEKNQQWTLMCPDKCRGLSDIYGDEFKQLYESYESQNMGTTTIPARKLWLQILDSQIETGTPYMLYKDAANMKSNQKNIGTIKSSNLCTEIMEVSTDKETAVCNLGSIALSKFVIPNKNISELRESKIRIMTKTNCIYCKLVKYLMNKNSISYTETILDDDDERLKFYESQSLSEGLKQPINSVPQIFINDKRIGGYSEFRAMVRNDYDFEQLHKVTRTLTRNLNNVIDINFYPTPETKISNMRHRPIGIGVQGLADTFALLDTEFDSEFARKINKHIFETIYHAALTESIKLAKEQGTYETFEGSPASQGILQFDMWNVAPDSGLYNWGKLKKEIQTYGLRNSLLVAPMPTASTSQIMGNNECFEPFTSNIYLRRTLAGEFIVMNKYLLEELIHLGLWNREMKDTIIYYKGSIQNIDTIPDCIKRKYKISWEIPMKSLIEMSRDRGAYICQSQSMNLWMESPTYDKLTAMHFFAWKCGLKTGMYYLRSKAKAAAQQFTIDPNMSKKLQNKKVSELQQDSDEICESCSG
jgi:ribonucleoside-diphosphate reductase alpha subunit